MATRKTAIQKVERFVREVQHCGVHLRKVILFGSYAKNRQHKYSDIDVALVADEFIGVGFEDIALFAKALIKHYIIQPKTYSTADFKEGDPFIEEIKKTGIEIKIPKK